MSGWLARTERRTRRQQFQPLLHDRKPSAAGAGYQTKVALRCRECPCSARQWPNPSHTIAPSLPVIHCNRPYAVLVYFAVCTAYGVPRPRGLIDLRIGRCLSIVYIWVEESMPVLLVPIPLVPKYLQG
ncbi:hypothetical protein BDV09DRAFT_159042 [Aspergillus tetrazonus]